MAGIETQSSTMSFVLFSGLVILSSVLAAAKDVVSLPPLPKRDHDFLENCTTKLHPSCGEEIKEAVYAYRTMSYACCKNLVDGGQACHKKFVKVTAPYYPEPSRSKAPAIAAQTWSDCVERVTTCFAPFKLIIGC